MLAKTAFRYFNGSRACVLATGIAAMFWACEASAQSSTNCIAMGGGMVHCDTMDMSPPRPVEVYQPRNDGGAVLGNAIGGIIARSRESAFRKRVGGMLANGDCQGAARYAYQKGRLDVGAEISRMCRQGTPGLAVAPAPATRPAPAGLPAMSQPQQRPQTRAISVLPTGFPTAAPASAPRPAVAAQSMGASPGKRQKWQRYYTALIEAGKAPKEAKAMADGEFGPID